MKEYQLYDLFDSFSVFSKISDFLKVFVCLLFSADSQIERRSDMMLSTLWRYKNSSQASFFFLSGVILLQSSYPKTVFVIVSVKFQKANSPKRIYFCEP